MFAARGGTLTLRHILPCNASSCAVLTLKAAAMPYLLSASNIPSAILTIIQHHVPKCHLLYIYCWPVAWWRGPALSLNRHRRRSAGLLPAVALANVGLRLATFVPPGGHKRAACRDGGERTNLALPSLTALPRSRANSVNAAWGCTTATPARLRLGGFGGLHCAIVRRACGISLSRWRPAPLRVRTC